METKEFIEIMRDIVDAYDTANEMKEYQNDEIAMWRNKFLQEHSKYDPKTSRRLRDAFLNLSSEDLMETSPEYNLESILEMIKLSDSI